MNSTLPFRQKVVLGLVVLLALAATGFGLTSIGAKQGLFAERCEVTVGFADAHDIRLGTPVRLRGMEVGQVTAIEYPDSDEPDATMLIRMEIDADYRDRIHADASASVYSTGMLGSRVIAIKPGSPTAGPLVDGHLNAETTPDLAETAQKLTATAEKFGATADEAKQLIQQVRTGDGTLSKLIRDDDMYNDLKGLANDSRTMVQRANTALGTVEGEVAKVDEFVQDGRETLQSVRQGTDAVGNMPIIRGYVEDAAKLLVRPKDQREAMTYTTDDLFLHGTAVLSEAGQHHILGVANWLKTCEESDAEIVVTSLHDPDDKTQTRSSARELTKAQCETIIATLKEHGSHKVGWFSSKNMTPLGLGFGPSPVISKEKLPASYVEVILFTPQ